MQSTPPGPVRRLAWATDLHLDLAEHVSEVGRRFRARGADALVITGDVATHSMLGGSLGGLSAAVGVPIFFVLGNHDYYGSSIAATHTLARRLHRPSAGITWLRAAGVVSLSESTALVGIDGLYDGGYGTPEAGVHLRDWWSIDEMRGGFAQRLAFMTAHGKRTAEEIEPTLRMACALHRRVIFATHVPPFPEAAAWKGEAKIARPYLPFYAAKSMGDMLRRVAADYPSTELLVLAGHTHGAGEAQIAPNLIARTGGATYGDPEIVDVLAIDAGLGRAA